MKCDAVLSQMVVILRNLTFAAFLSPSEASEEFHEGVIKCFRALLPNLHPCFNQFSLCKQSLDFPKLLETRDLQTPTGTLKHDLEQGESSLAFLQSEAVLAAVGHWLLPLLKVGTADALAFFLPGVVSQFCKVLHISKTIISRAAGRVEAIDQAIRGLAEYLMIVLQDDTDLSGLDTYIDTSVGHK
ncbi:hypothetical protein QQP08_022543 [Theobroma cacao]|nr:hypothetical protein QQP08_022543 [Theobroma cacao]